MIEKIKTNWWFILIIFLIAFGVRIYDLNAAGQTWDELPYYDGGKEYVRNLYHLDFNPDHWGKNFEHPPVAKWIYGIASIPTYKNFQGDQFSYGRLASACMGALTIIIVYFFVLELFKSKKIAILSALILCFLPTFIAHNKVMGLETPSALFYTWAVYWFYIGLTRKRNFLLLSSIPAGLAIGTRFNNGHIIFSVSYTHLTLPTN